MDVSTPAPAAPAANVTTPQAPISSDPPPAAPAAPASFSWDTAGLDPAALATVQAKGWKGVPDAVTSYQHLEKAIGVPPERLVRLPAPTETDPKAWDPVFKQLGRPETADKYVIPVPPGDKGEFATAVKPWMHEAGLSQSQATKLAEKWNGFITKSQADQATATEAKNLADVSALKQAWGGEYDKNEGLVNKAAETFGMTDAQLSGLKSSMGPKAAMEFLFNLGSKLGVEDTSVPGMGGQLNSFGGMSPESAQAEIEKLKRDPDFAQLFNSKDTKSRMEARTQMDRLQKLAYPGMSPVPGTSAAARRA